MPDDFVIVKLDFVNAFNSLRRDCMLCTVADIIPEAAPFCYLSYSHSSNLLYDGHLIQSAEGMQQDDPLGSLLFCLTI